MNNEELLAEIAKRPVLERLPLLNAAMQLRLITVHEARAVIELPEPRPVRKTATKKTTSSGRKTT